MESQAKQQQFIIYSVYVYIQLPGVFWPVFYALMWLKSIHLAIF